MVPVLKKNGQIRVCVDLSELNKAIKRERFQIPVAEEIFARMKGAVFFTVLDATSGFWQIPLSEDSSLLTTFITPFGRFRFTRLPFGRKRAVHSPNGLVRTMSWLANREKSTSLNFFAWSYRELKKGFD